ncbi:S-layer protein [Candidatus Parvarchaeota archaeon]|nr:S-layer protein [Candidatus Parvarchaeota archaeon]
MKGVNVKKIAALAAGTLMLGASVAVADVVYGNVQLVDQTGQPVVKVVVGEKAAASDGVAAANIAAAIANMAYKSSTLTASVTGASTCAVAGGTGSGAGTCAVTNKKAVLEVTIPGVIGGAYQFSTLVNDYVDRTIGNRVKVNSEDTYTGTTTTNDQQDDIVPFRFTTLSSLQAVYKITGSSFNAFATATVQDPKAAKSYTEQQTLYVGAQGIYKRLAAGPVSRYSGILYQVRFTNDDYGLAYCTASATTNDSACQSSDRTLNHRVPIKFLGSEWRISDLQPAVTTTTHAQYPISGGSMKLAKESAYKIVNIGESLDAGEVKVKLSDISVATGSANDHYAIIDILDANGAVLAQQQILPGSTYTYTTPSGKSTRIHVYQTSPGFTLNAKWAEMAVYSDELTLTDGQKINDDNKEWKTELLWKNRDTTNGGISALREILVYTDHSNVINKDFAKGDAVSIIKSPSVFSLSFDGIDLGDSDYDTLTFTIDNNANPLTVSNLSNTMAGGETCATTSTSGTKLIRINSGVANAFTIEGGNQTATGGSYSTDTMYYDPVNSRMFFKSSSSVDCYYFAYGGVNATLAWTGEKDETFVQYKTVGTIGDRTSGGSFSLNRTGTGNVEIRIYEDAGRYNNTANAVATMNFTAANSSGSWTFKPSSSSTGLVTFDSSSTWSADAATNEEAPYMTDRGTLFQSMSTDTVQFATAKKYGNLKWTLSAAGEAVADASLTTLAEGESKELTGGVKIKVKEITQTVGSCTATGSGAPTCTVDSTGVSAVILPNNAASVEVTEPYKLTSNLVVLDSDAGSSGSYITVGGPLVNSVTRDLLEGSDVDFQATNVVVKEIGSNKIVVAGWSADDTIEAANEFVAALSSSQ